MNRLIKFRIWNGEKWITNSSIGHLSNPFATNLNEYFSFKRLVFQQYTGLKDKNEKEIYEGDIIRRENQFDTFEHAVVTFNTPSFVALYIDKSDLLRSFNYEVVGNIFENPELLK